MYVDGSVIKIASRCNLNCSYCYMYNKGDDTYKLQPKFMSDEVRDSFIEKVRNYVLKYNKKAFIFVFHGGEPLLAGKDFFRNFVTKAREVVKDCKLTFVIQTNGVLIDEEWAQVFDDLDITVGVSLDGTKESNDIYRVYHNGKSAYEEIKNGLNLSLTRNKKKPGVLSVIDYKQDPEEVYRHVKELEVNGVNLLYPDDNYDDGFEDDLSLGKWLSSVYDLWVQDDYEVDIDQFHKLRKLIMGVPVDDEYYGMGRPNTFILETDGELQPNDPLRVCKHGFTKTPLNIKENEIDDLFSLPLSFYYYNNHQNLCKKCNECDLVSVCGGGYVINRYSSTNGFDNPSIYCKSLAYFITHVQNHIVSMVGNDLADECEVDKLQWSEVEALIAGNTYEETPFLTSFA